MEAFTRLVQGLSRNLDRVAGWALVATMLLVVGNIILRLLGRPIQGTYEWVGFLTALAIGLALAQCAVQDGHIAVTFLVDKLAPRAQAVVVFCGGAVSVAFLAFAAWEIGRYATSMVRSGEVAMTTQVPFYPFIYLIAFGFLVFCLIVFTGLREPIRKVAKK